MLKTGPSIALALSLRVELRPFTKQRTGRQDALRTPSAPLRTERGTFKSFPGTVGDHPRGSTGWQGRSPRPAGCVVVLAPVSSVHAAARATP